VRDVLLGSIAPAEAAEVLERVSRDDVVSRVSTYVGERLGQTFDFGAMLVDPSAAGRVAISEEAQPFARVAASILRRLGGEYAELAERLAGSGGGHARRPEPIGTRT